MPPQSFMSNRSKDLAAEEEEEEEANEVELELDVPRPHYNVMWDCPKINKTSLDVDGIYKPRGGDTIGA